MNFGEILQSKRWKVLTGYVYNIGAVIVLMGALFKLEHWPYSGIILIVGLSTEAFIFLISAFEPPMHMPEWEKVYPQLSEEYVPEDEDDLSPVRTSGTPVIGQLDKVLEQADISPEILGKLSKGLTDLSNTASSISDISSATIATDMYVKNLTAASESMDSLNEITDKANEAINESVGHLVESYQSTAQKIGQKGEDMLGKLSSTSEKFSTELESSSQKLISAYDNASQTISKGFGHLEESASSYQTNLNSLNKSLESLAKTYSEQLRQTTEQLQSTQKFFAEIGQLNQVIGSSLSEVQKYKDNAESLNKQLEALNNVYSNMLGAMNYKK